MILSTITKLLATLFVVLSSLKLYSPLYVTLFCFALISASFFSLYYKKHSNSDFAYWLLAYNTLAIAFISIFLLKSHYGCLSMIGECYVESLPVWLDDLAFALNLSLMALNTVALLQAKANIEKIINLKKRAVSSK
ncbi:hypothetical protein OAM26_04250 [Porticoccaceae bacterium]|nr:hypothetical protein [Porticoccaceae bacterium]